MQLFFRTLTIFFGTLIAAALVALGEPAVAELNLSGAASPALDQVVVALLGSEARP